MAKRRQSRPQAVIEFRLEGVEELIKKLEALGDRASGVLVEASLAGADVLKDAANRDAPGPHVETEVSELKKHEVTVAVGPDREHWYYRFIETGATTHEIDPKNRQALVLEGGSIVKHVSQHPGVVARPFLRPAVDNQKDKAFEAIGRVIRDAIEAGTKPE